MSKPLTRRQFILGSAALATPLPSRLAWATDRRPALPIPAQVDGTNGRPIDLAIRRGEWSFMPGVVTPTLGISQAYLAPTLRTRKGTELNLAYHNTLEEGVAIHGHGLHVPGEVDGGPQSEMPPGGRWRPTLNIQQRAATCWYHSHTHGKSGEQTYRGLAGMIIIDDDESDAVELPSGYGVDDLPVIIQDRTFDAAGKLVYSLMDASEDGWYGDTAIINGAIAPRAKVPSGKVRLRLLNGANARFYIVSFSDGRTFHKVACDGGLLPEPVPMAIMEMSPGERSEIVVDLSDGVPVELSIHFEDEVDDGITGLFRGAMDAIGLPYLPKAATSLALVPDSTLVPHLVPLPRRLTTISRPKENEITHTREFLLKMSHDDSHGTASTESHGGHGAMDMSINGVAMDMNVINERVRLGAWERWRIRSDQGGHPFHAHGCSFLVEKMEGDPPPPEQQGWKDTVILDDDGWSEIVVRFDHIATDEYPYMYHCHILEHEDRGMMGQFTVT